MIGFELETGGETVHVESELGWVDRLVREAGAGVESGRRSAPTLYVHAERDRRAFPKSGLTVLARGAWSGAREVVVEDVCGTGFDLRLKIDGGLPLLTFRWRPRPSRVLEGQLLPSRFQLLARCALIQYPVMWWAAARGRAPLHAISCTAGDAVPLLAGPGGVGKSTLLQAELLDEASATTDNLCVGDGHVTWGVVEPMRIEGGAGRRMPHGRREVALEGRVAQLIPDRVVVVSRGTGDAARLSPCDPETAIRSLVTGTYMAGELRRLWPFAAILAAGTGCGPSHPPIAETARRFATRLPCYQLELARQPGTRLLQMLKPMEASA